MAQMNISWTKLALSDLDEAYNYIVVNNPDIANQTIERIEKALDALVLYPDMGRIGRVVGTRELIITRTPFILPYRIQGNQIEILAVVHAARRWPKAF